jgi:hypothetical protein
MAGAMILPSQLSKTTLGDLFGALYRERTTGVLELIPADGGVTRRVHLCAGLITHIEDGALGPRLGELLATKGFLRRSEVDELARSSSSAQKRIGRTLADERVLPAPVVAAVVREQLRARLEALFGLGDAELRFHVARRAKLVEVQALPLLPADFLHGRPRKRAGRSGEAPPPAVEALPEPAATPRERALRVLGLGPNAGLGEVRRTFRRLAVTLHPDRHPELSDRERAGLISRFTEVSAAYHELIA